MKKLTPGLELLKCVVSALVFPQYCPSCKKNWLHGDGYMCDECWKTLPAAKPGLHRKDPVLRNRVFVAFAYNDATRSLIHLLKFHGRRDIAVRLGRETLARLVDRLAENQPEAVIPVPLHRTRERERGYDQNLTIAECLADGLRIPLRTDLLRRVRNTRPQSRLSDEERRKNMVNAFALVRSQSVAPRGGILLVDDVIHTGATVRGCIQALKTAGVSQISVVAACG